MRFKVYFLYFKHHLRAISNLFFMFLEFVNLHHQPQPRVEHQIDGAPTSDLLPLTKDSGILAITKKMRHPDSGLEVKDRIWLKLKIPNAFLGSDLVEWLHEKVEGFQVSLALN